MATHHSPPPAIFLGHPQSPPMTPGSRTHTRCMPQGHHTSPTSRRAGMFVQTPPLEFIEPTGQDHHFNFTRPQSVPSSRPSSVSGRAYAATTPQESQDECESDEESEESDEEEEAPMRRVEKAQFVLEELDSDPDSDCDVEVVQPDHCEDAKSDRSRTKAEITARLNELALEESSEDEEEKEERERRYQQKKKRWSAGIFKRSYSQSVEGDSSYSDNDPLDDVDQNARRLRRRVRGPIPRRGSLIFEDRGVSNTNNIQEVEEPDEGIVLHSKGPPSIPSDDAFTLDELPFYEGYDGLPFHPQHDTMDVEYESV